MKAYLPLLIAGILLLILGIVALLLLFQVNKKNRHFEKKGVAYFGLVSFLFFGLLGMTGLIKSATISLPVLYNWFQGIGIVIGIVYAWLIFSLYEWTKKNSYYAETLTLFFLTSVSFIGFMISYSLFEYFWGSVSAKAIPLTKALWWLLIPYLLLRTYHLILEIPTKTYRTWYFPVRKPPSLHTEIENSIEIYISLAIGYNSNYRIEALNSRIAKHAKFSAFFENFVSDYNQFNTQNPITHLREDDDGKPLGWIFKTHSTKKGWKKVIDPAKIGTQQFWEGDFIIAQRVPVLPEHATEQPETEDNWFDTGTTTNTDDDIIIVEEK